MDEAIKHFDFSILSGHRSRATQDMYLRLGVSKRKNSLHLKEPSLAVDIAPWPIDWKDEERFRYLAGWIMAIATMSNIKLRWGGDWDRDTDLHDQTFFDLGHFEIVE
jgi:peptidoglycan L-alanyl-D-glutamate endopeptidase CwlK